MSVSGISAASSVTPHSLQNLKSQLSQSEVASEAQQAYSDTVQLSHAAASSGTPASSGSPTSFVGSLIKFGLSLLK